MASNTSVSGRYKNLHTKLAGGAHQLLSLRDTLFLNHILLADGAFPTSLDERPFRHRNKLVWHSRRRSPSKQSLLPQTSLQRATCDSQAALCRPLP
ncbi:hypothetical protein TNCV_1592241 [Trichonephila clavipes]|nr:hypothetical protein TNCV_1592241 [Trichonephila clavipes]